MKTLLVALSLDCSETKNLAANYPEKVMEMEKAWNQHAAENHALALQDPPSPQPSKRKNAKSNLASAE